MINWSPFRKDEVFGQALFRLLRQYWPKATNFKEVKKKDVASVIVQLNDRPRKKLGYKTPAELMEKHMAAIAA
ncbi:MAG: IS30 family transposase [Candidatus Endobugula sp.]|jgi:IS30 family transposase